MVGKVRSSRSKSIDVTKSHEYQLHLLGMYNLDPPVDLVALTQSWEVGVVRDACAVQILAPSNTQPPMRRAPRGSYVVAFPGSLPGF